MTTTATGFYVTGGTLRQDAPSYVERRADTDLYQGLTQGEYCYVLHARQMGKSSLMVHTTARLRREGFTVAAFELTALGQNLTAEQWYDGLLGRIGRELELEEEVEEYWLAHERLSPLQRWLGAIQEVVLAHRPGRIVIFLDEIDAVRSLPFSTDEFFAAIRECYNRRSQDPEFGRLTFCLLGVATPSDLIQDTRTTPFNIGRRIELTDFTPTEAAPLARGLAGGRTPPLEGEGGLGHETRFRDPAPLSLAGKEDGGLGPPGALLERVLDWTGGHPYLTQRLCRAVADDASVADAPGVDRLCKALFLSKSAQERDDNLLFVRERLLRSEADRASLLDLYAQVWRGRPVAPDDTNQLISLLRLAGIARVDGSSLRVRNRIYQRVFDPAWVTQHMPDAELRRQRAAYRQGLLRAAAVSALILVVVGGVALIAVTQARLARRATAREAEQRRLAQEGQKTLRRHLYGARLNLAHQAWEEGNLGRAHELLESQRPEPGQEDLRGFEWRLLWRLCHGDPPRLTLQGHTDWVANVAFSPDGRMLATSSVDRTVRLWAAASGREIATLTGHTDAVHGIAFSPDGKLLASGSQDGTVKLWDLGARRETATLQSHKEAVIAVAFSPDGTYLASCGQDSPIRLWDVASRREAGIFRGSRGVWHALAFSPDGKWLANGTPEGPVQLWDVTSRRPIASLKGHSRWVNTVAFSPDGQMLASGSDDGTVRLWEVTSKQSVGLLQGATLSVAFSPDGKRLLAGGGDGTIKLWELGTRRLLAAFKGHERDNVNGVAFSPDGKIMASVGDTVKLWNAVSQPSTAPFVQQKAAFHALAFSPDGRTLGTGDDEGSVQLWEVASGRRLVTLPRHRARIRQIAFSPDGQTLATRGVDHLVKLWAPSSTSPMKPGAGRMISRVWREVARVPGVQVGEGDAIAFSPDGRLLAMAGDDRTVKLWDVAARRLVAPLGRHRSDIWAMAFAPDSRTLAVGSENLLSLWDVRTRREAAFHRAVAFGPLSFSPDGRHLATRGFGSGVRLWDLATRRTFLTIPPTDSGLVEFAFAPDSKCLAVASASTVALWNLAVEQPAVTLREPAGVVNTVAFSSDGDLLATATSSGIVRVWRSASFLRTDQPVLSQVPEVWSCGSDRAVRLEWRPAPSAVAYSIYRGPAGATRAQLRRLNTRPLTESVFADRGPELVNGRPQTYAVAAIYRGPEGKPVEGPLLLHDATPVALPPGFEGCRINEGAKSGSVRVDGATGQIIVRGSGNKIWYEDDECYFACRPLTGDFRISVKMLGRPTATSATAQAGLMVRESLVRGARHASLLALADGGFQCKWRSTADDTTDTQDVDSSAALRMPLLLRLTRRGDTILAEYARPEDGRFQSAGEPMRFDPPLPKTVHVGLVISAEDSRKISEARFSGLEIKEL
jgi:WD40 repeat protein